MGYDGSVIRTMARGSERGATRHASWEGNLQKCWRIYDSHDFQASGDVVPVPRLISP